MTDLGKISAPFVSEAEFLACFEEQRDALLQRARRRIRKEFVPYPAKPDADALPWERGGPATMAELARERAAQMPSGLGLEHDLVDEALTRCLTLVTLPDGTPGPQWQTFRGDSRRSTWLVTILDRTVADFYREQDEESRAFLTDTNPRPKKKKEKEEKKKMTCPCCAAEVPVEWTNSWRKGHECPGCGLGLPPGTPADFERYVWGRGLLRAPWIAVWTGRWLESTVDSAGDDEDAGSARGNIADAASFGNYLPATFWLHPRWWSRIVRALYIQGRVRMALRSLPKDYRMIIWLHFFFGYAWRWLAARFRVQQRTLEKDLAPVIHELEVDLRDLRDLLRSTRRRDGPRAPAPRALEHHRPAA